MKVVFTTLALLGLTYAQSLAGLPACATTCALNAIVATGCSATDAKCVCSSNSFLTSVGNCIQTACSKSDIQATYKFAESYCGAAGVTITIPGASSTAAPASSASKPASSSAAASSAKSSAPAPAPVSTSAASTSSSAAPESSTPSAAASTSAASASASSYTGGSVQLGLGSELMMGALGIAVAVW